MMFASILVALVMERPLMFFTDQPGRLPTSGVNAPAETLRITPAHYAELYGVASAHIERFWGGVGVFTNDNWESYIDTRDVQFRHLPIAWLSWGGYDPGYFSPSNRVIESYRIAAKTGPNDAPILHKVADRIFNNFNFSPFSGSSLIRDSEPPEIDWCDNPWDETSSNDWVRVWAAFLNVTNDILVAAWTGLGHRAYDDFPWDDSSTPPYNMVSHLQDLDGFGYDQPRYAQYYETLEAIRTRGEFETISSLMSRAIPTCVPSAVTNRTLRFDRSFLTALEAAASAEDTYYDTRQCDYGSALHVSSGKTVTMGGSSSGAFAISLDSDGELHGSISGSVPEMSPHEYTSSTTNNVDVYDPICAVYVRDTRSDFQVDGARYTFYVAMSNIWEAARAADWGTVTNIRFTASQRTGMTATWEGRGAAFAAVIPSSGNYVGFNATLILARHADVTWPGAPYYSSPGEDGLYWRMRKVDVDEWFQEGMRWSDDVGDASSYNKGYYDMDPTLDLLHRGQQLRNRHAISLHSALPSAYSNELMTAMAALSAACVQKCSEISGVGTSGIYNPASLCAIGDQDVARGKEAVGRAMGDMAVSVIQNSFTVEHRTVYYPDAPGGIVEFDVLRAWDGESGRELMNWILSPSSKQIPAGTLLLHQEGDFASSGTNIAARVAGAGYRECRRRVKYYNLSNLGE